MKKILFLSVKVILLILLMSSCGGMAKRTMFGTTEKNLIKTVAVEQGCSRENIKILDKVKGLHGATYSLDVCGTRMVYKEVGSVFMEKSQADKTIKGLQN